MQVKRAELSKALSSELNDKIQVDEAPMPSANLPGLLKRMRVGEDKRVILQKVAVTPGAITVEKGKQTEVRNSIHSLYAGFKPPSWSRWLTFTVALMKIITCYVFCLSDIAGRFFGSHIQVKEQKVPNDLALQSEGAGIS